MQEITTENDIHVYKIGIKNKGTVFVDGFELASRCAEIDGVLGGDEPKPSDIADAMREVAWMEDGDMAAFTNHELFSAASKALREIEKLGNA